MFSVYKIVNSINNKVYIGITSKSILARFKTHIKASRYSTRFNKICNALKKYGAENFSVVLVDHAHSWEEVCEKERRYIKEYDSMNNGYNLTIGGEGQYGMKHSDKTKALWSSQRKGKLNGMWGRVSPMRGKKQRPETIEKMRAAKLVNNWQKGRPSWNRGKKGLATASHIGAIKLAQSIPVTIGGISYKSKLEAYTLLGISKYRLNQELWALRTKI